MLRIVIIFFAVILQMNTYAWFLPYANPNNVNYPKYVDLDTKIYKAWQTYKDNYVESNGLVFKKYDSEYNNGKYFVESSDSRKFCVSEGIGYAMLIALYMNDQTTFDKVYSAGKKYFGYPSLSGASWKVAYDKNNPNSAYSVGSGSATDADLDVAAALVMASELAKKGYWSDNGYSSDANTLINAIYSKDQSGGWLKLGTNWGGSEQQNPSYFAPAYLRLFDKWQGQSRWNQVISNHYNTLKKNPGYSKGIIRNWCNSSGGPMTTGDYWAEQSKYMSWEAIRVPWRIGVDAIWYNSTDANSYVNNAMSFASDPEELGTGMFLATSPYTMQEDKYWLRATPKAMWGSCAAAKGGDIHNSYAERLAYYFKGDMFNEGDHYYTESLTLLGALVVSGSFANIYEDLKSNPGTTNRFIEKLTLDMPYSNGLDFQGENKEEVNVFAKLAMATDWTITIKGLSSGFEISNSGYGSSPHIEWKSFMSDNKFLSVGEDVEITLTAGSLSDKITTKIISLPPAYNVVFIDDFEDGDTKNFLNGSWDIVDGSGATRSVVDDNGNKVLMYEFNNNGKLETYFSSNESEEANFRNLSSFNIKCKGSSFKIELIPSDAYYDGSGYWYTTVDASSDWQELVIPPYKFDNDGSTKFYSSDPAVQHVRAIRITPLESNGTIYIDDVVIIGDVGLTTGIYEAVNTNLANKDVQLTLTPNPFNPILNIYFSQHLLNNYITIKVYNIQGKVVDQIFNGIARKTNLHWNASKFASGIYYIKLQSKNISITKKAVLIK